MMEDSFHSRTDRKQIITCCCFFKTLGSPLGSRACSVLTAVAIWCCLHHTGVCQCEKASSWTKDWTTVCRQGLLTKTTFQSSAVSPFSRAFCSNIHSSSRSTDRGSCAAGLPYIFPLSLLSRGGAGWHWHSPLSQVQAGTTHMLYSATLAHKTPRT